MSGRPQPPPKRGSAAPSARPPVPSPRGRGQPQRGAPQRGTPPRAPPRGAPRGRGQPSPRGGRGQPSPPSRAPVRKANTGPPPEEPEPSSQYNLRVSAPTTMLEPAPPIETQKHNVLASSDNMTASEIRERSKSDPPIPPTDIDSDDSAELMKTLLNPENQDAVDALVKSIVPPARNKASNPLSKFSGLRNRNSKSIMFRKPTKQEAMPQAEAKNDRKRRSFFPGRKKLDEAPPAQRTGRTRAPKTQTKSHPSNEQATSTTVEKMTSPRGESSENRALNGEILSWMSKPNDPSTQIFGMSIEIAVERGRPDSISQHMPLIVLRTISRVREHVKAEGIFRISGGHDKIQYWKKRYDLGDDPDLYQESDIHVVSGLLKLYLRELPEFILTTKLAPNFEASKSLADPHIRAMYVKSLVDQLPPPNFAVLHSLMILLSEIISYEEVNFMGVENLSLIFSPTLKCSVNVVQTILENVEIIFDQ